MQGQNPGFQRPFFSGLRGLKSAIAFVTFSGVEVDLDRGVMLSRFKEKETHEHYCEGPKGNQDIEYDAHRWSTPDLNRGPWT